MGISYLFLLLHIKSVKGANANQSHIIVIDKCWKRDVVFKGESCPKIFCQWLFQPRQGYTVISHNGDAFDIQFVLRVPMRT